MRIQVENCQSVMKFDQALLDLIEEAAKGCLAVEKFETDCEISVILVDDEEIRQINLEHRKIDKPTDVLSFPMTEICKGKLEVDAFDIDPDSGLLMLGDIIISTDRVFSQAKQYGHSVLRELIFLLTHGVFHLLGYDHLTDDEEKQMMTKQETVLESMGLKRAQEP